MNTHHWIFISPHLDDVVLSCGGLVWDLAQGGHRVEVLTLFAGIPVGEEFSVFAQFIHQEWGLPGAAVFRARRQEDQAACAVLGVDFRHYDWQDAIYRRDPHTGEFMVNDDEALFGKSPEPALVDEITNFMKETLPEDARIGLPIGLGGHIDHRAVVMAGERIGRVDYHYADYPYVLTNFDAPGFSENRLKRVSHFLSQDALHAWQEAVLCYTSQLSGFWRDEEETRLSLRNYLAGGGGGLWEQQTV